MRADCPSFTCLPPPHLPISFVCANVFHYSSPLRGQRSVPNRAGLASCRSAAAGSWHRFFGGPRWQCFLGPWFPPSESEKQIHNNINHKTLGVGGLWNRVWWTSALLNVSDSSLRVLASACSAARVDRVPGRDHLPVIRPIHAVRIHTRVPGREFF